MLFKLKAGGFVSGSSAQPGGARFFNARKRNIVESDQDLAAEDPNKFEPYNGPRPDYLDNWQEGTTRTSATALQSQQDKTPSTPEEMEEQAQRWIEKAAELRQKAQEAKLQRMNEARSGPQERQGKQNPTQVESLKAPITSESDYHARLDRMSLSDLKAHAKERKVDLKGATTAEDVRKAIKAHED